MKWVALIELGEFWKRIPAINRFHEKSASMTGGAVGVGRACVERVAGLHADSASPGNPSGGKRCAGITESRLGSGASLQSSFFLCGAYDAR